MSNHSKLIEKQFNVVVVTNHQSLMTFVKTNESNILLKHLNNFISYIVTSYGKFYLVHVEKLIYPKVDL